MSKAYPTIKLGRGPYHRVQYLHSVHIYGLVFETRATTTEGIARAAARAAREDVHFWTNDRRRIPQVTSIDGIALIPRNWQDEEMQHLWQLVDREVLKFRPPVMHESSERP